MPVTAGEKDISPQIFCIRHQNIAVSEVRLLQERPRGRCSWMGWGGAMWSCGFPVSLVREGHPAMLEGDSSFLPPKDQPGNEMLLKANHLCSLSLPVLMDRLSTLGNHPQFVFPWEGGCYHGIME